MGDGSLTETASLITTVDGHWALLPASARSTYPVMLRGTGITVLTYQDASPRKRLTFCRGIYILLDKTVGRLGGKSIGSQGIANDWVGGRCGALSLLFAHDLHFVLYFAADLVGLLIS